jgi:hypothetical protein
MILGPASATQDVVASNLGTVADLFRNVMFPELWAAAEEYGIDPVGMVAQSIKETGGGTFGGRVKPWFYNTAGIKVRHVVDVMHLVPTEDGDHALVHQMFPNWRVGAVAHAQRLRDYCLAPFDGLVVDPRHGFGSRGITTWAELGGRWAPSPTYGTEIEAMMIRLAQ